MTRRVAEGAAREAGGDARVGGQRDAEVLRVCHRNAIEVGLGVDGQALVVVARFAERAEAFEGEADGVHLVVAAGADGVAAVLRQALTQGARHAGVGFGE